MKVLVVAAGALVAACLVVVVVSFASFTVRAVRDMAGPGVVTPDRSGITGTWTNPDGARLVFRADGTCAVSGVPDPMHDGTWNGLPFNGTGTWSVDPYTGGDVGDSGGVDVDVDDHVAFLSTWGNPAHPDMDVTIGDPDNGDVLTFTRQSA
jgi:hypothetical protein